MCISLSGSTTYLSSTLLLVIGPFGIVSSSICGCSASCYGAPSSQKLPHSRCFSLCITNSHSILLIACPVYSSTLPLSSLLCISIFNPSSISSLDVLHGLHYSRLPSEAAGTINNKCLPLPNIVSMPKIIIFFFCTRH